MGDRIGYQKYQVEHELGSRPMQVTGDGPPRVLDYDAGL